MRSRCHYPFTTASLGEPRRSSTALSRVENLPRFAGVEAVGLISHATESVILIAEEDPHSQSFLKGLLQARGYRVLEARNGLQTLDIAESERLDLLLLDLGLVLCKRPCLIEQLRDIAQLESLPIVVMTAHEPESHKQAAVAAGCDEFLVKPVDFDRLDAVLDYFVPAPVEV